MDINKNNKIREFIAIEYPGRVVNTDNMIETLGGSDELSRAIDEKQKLQLKFNPKNFYCKPAISTEQEETTGMLVKLKVKRVKNNPEKKVEYMSAELVGTVKSIYRFNNFSDYQYLPIRKNEKTGEVENFYHNIVPEDPQAGPKWLREKVDVPIFLPPTSFCRSDVIQSSMLRNENKVFSIQENDEVVSFAVTNRTSRLKNGIMVQYTNDLNIEVPSKPNDKVDISSLVSEEEEKILRDLFERRPIWTLAALRAHIRDPPKRLSSALAGIAFYYTTGPWRNCFVRFGYDPRKDFNSRYYQLLEYRVKQGAGFKVDAATKRPSAMNKRIRVPQQAASNTNVEETFAIRQKEAIFNKDTIPPYRARQYQFIDIDLKKVKEMIDNVNGPLAGAICNEKRGWLPPNFIEEVREILAKIAQENMKAKNLSLDEVTTESVGDSLDFDEDASESEEESNESNDSNNEEIDMDIDEDL